MSCGGNCGSCSGCARELELTARELDFLRLLGQVAFLPVARAMGNASPVYLEDGPDRREENGRVLECLEKKALISLDYDKPLKGSDLSAYRAYPILGSIALTLRGQQVLELLDYQGITEA